MTRHRILLISDTHIPARAPRLPRAVVEAIDEVDLVVHAGDWVDVATLDVLERLSPRFVGVYGNNDHGVLRERLPEVARFELDGLRFAVIHETGATTGREKRADVAFPDVDVLIFGHSHIPWDSVSPRGMRLLNPGSPTDRRRQPRCTLMIATVEDGVLTDVEVRTVERDFSAEVPEP
ncbi:YfcE family phosphodiesterase [Leifsonia sp. ALI-44-B]|uniref:metallophosphoesterase family protein n=1 Tax=Leifsonia sp. ALI-44-B TaxID=1933776 RepID=UPI00097C78EE|nr:metallophosphoesterase [Leifsonia sp. ALI-44-B]ONI63459.1 YfcE family phosphodiesterase [Leifsonia sp. ALI-44-B]